MSKKAKLARKLRRRLERAWQEGEMQIKMDKAFEEYLIFAELRNYSYKIDI